MTIEVIHNLTDINLPNVAWQVEQVQSGRSQELWFTTPHEDAVKLVQDIGLPLDKVYDVYGQRYLCEIDTSNGIWWRDLSFPNLARLEVNDGHKFVVSQGHKIARIRGFRDDNHIVQAVTWLDEDGQVDYKDIYQRDGRKFATQYFSNGSLLSTAFYFGQQQEQVQNFYHHKQCDFVLAFGEKYGSSEQYINSVLQKTTDQKFHTT